eukprot:3503401-Amphidinium_carterae.1
MQATTCQVYRSYSVHQPARRQLLGARQSMQTGQASKTMRSEKRAKLPTHVLLQERKRSRRPLKGHLAVTCPFERRAGTLERQHPSHAWCFDCGFLLVSWVSGIGVAEPTYLHGSKKSAIGFC